MKRWQQNLYSLWLAQLIAALGLSMIIPFLPFYLRDLGVSGKEAVKIWSGFIYSAPFMISAFMQPVWGMLGETLKSLTHLESFAQVLMYLGWLSLQRRTSLQRLEKKSCLKQILYSPQILCWKSQQKSIELT